MLRGEVLWTFGSSWKKKRVNVSPNVNQIKIKIKWNYIKKNNIKMRSVNGKWIN